MSMDKNGTDHQTAASDKKKPPATGGLLLVSGLWIAGLGAVVHSTAPGPTANPVYLPATVETQVAEQVAGHRAETVENSVDFIVRFNEVEEVATCLDIFKEDPHRARDIFSDWAADYATLSGMTLKKTSYAGELILSWSTDDGVRPNRADIIAKQRDLQAMPVVKYADPDYTAHAGGTTQ